MTGARGGPRHAAWTTDPTIGSSTRPRVPTWSACVSVAMARTACRPAGALPPRCHRRRSGSSRHRRRPAPRARASWDRRCPPRAPVLTPSAVSAARMRRPNRSCEMRPRYGDVAAQTADRACGVVRPAARHGRDAPVRRTSRSMTFSPATTTRLTRSPGPPSPVTIGASGPRPCRLAYRRPGGRAPRCCDQRSGRRRRGRRRPLVQRRDGLARNARLVKACAQPAAGVERAARRWVRPGWARRP